MRIKGLTHDVTERKQAELALAERNTQLALAEKRAVLPPTPMMSKRTGCKFQKAMQRFMACPKARLRSHAVSGGL